jgi:hypothetical protein
VVRADRPKQARFARALGPLATCYDARVSTISDVLGVMTRAA